MTRPQHMKRSGRQVFALGLCCLALGATMGASTIGMGAPVRPGTVTVTIDIGGFFVFNPVAVQVPLIGNETAPIKAAKVKSAVDAALKAAGLPASTAPTPTSINTGSANVTDVNAGTTGETDTLTGGTVYGRAQWPWELLPGFSSLSGVNPTGGSATYATAFTLTDSALGVISLASFLNASQLTSLSLNGFLQQQFNILDAQLVAQAPSLSGDLVLDLADRMIIFNPPATALDMSLTNGTTDIALESGVQIQPAPEPICLPVLLVSTLVLRRMRVART